MAEKILKALERFRWINAVLASPDFTDARARVLVRLANYLNLTDGRCDPKVETLAAQSRQAPRTVRDALAAGAELGWLNRHVGGGRGRHSNYEFNMGPVIGTEETLRGGAGFAETLRPETVFAGALNPAAPRRKPCATAPSHIENRENRKNREPDGDFAKWYAVYPKHRSRGAAIRPFGRIVKSGKATVEDLIAGAIRYAAERAGQPLKYTKDPATWLKGECWLDEPLPQAEQQTTAQPRMAAAGGRIMPRIGP